MKGKWQVSRDKNEPEIIEGLIRCGCSVVPLDDPRNNGLPDLLVSQNTRSGKRTVLLEVKTEKADLRPSQRDFFATWKGEVYVVRNLVEALTIMGITK